MNRDLLGWLWVGGQAVLLGALILLPGGDDWAIPTWVTVLLSMLFIGGLALICVSALGLGSALTPTPVPTRSGTLTTSGLYRFVRHPIYTGVLAVVLSMTVRSGSWIHLFIGIAAFAFFDRKAAWEESQLRDRYPGYAEYLSLIHI